MTVYENICQGLPDDDPRRRRSPEVLRQVCEALEAVNLEPAHVVNELPAELSGGMRKRVGLARAIVGHPEIVLYDEPVTGLDPVNSAVVSLLITDIQERLRVTSVFFVVTHDIEQDPHDLRARRPARARQTPLRGTPESSRRARTRWCAAFADRPGRQCRALEIMEES